MRPSLVICAPIPAVERQFEMFEQAGRQTDGAGGTEGMGILERELFVQPAGGLPEEDRGAS
jgi:hypothetical protein